MTAIIQRSLSAGEIAPALYSRCDQTRYATGCRTLRNMYVMRHGGATSRPGTEFVAEILSRNSSPLPVRLLPFVFNDTQTYVLEIGTSQKVASNTKYGRVFKDGAPLVCTVKAISGVTQANPGVMTVTSHGFATGDTLYISGISGMTELNGQTVTVTSTGANTFSIGVNTTGYSAYSSGGIATGVSTSTKNSITGLTRANPGVVTSIAHGFSNGDPVYITGVVGMTQVNGKWYLANNVAANTFELYDFDGNQVNTSSYSAYSSGGSAQKAVKFAGIWATDSNLPYIQTDQTADILAIASSSTGAAEIRRQNHNIWSATALIGTDYYPAISAPTSMTGGPGAGNYEYWAATAVDANTGEESRLGVTGGGSYLSSSAAATLAAPITISWTAPTSGTVAYYNIYKYKGAWGLYGTSTTTSFIDNGTGTVDFSNPPPDVSYLASSRVPAPTPTVISSAQQRRIYSGFSDLPGKIAASRSGLFKNFMVKAASFADDPIFFTIIGKHVNEVRHILDLVKPVVFTSGGVFSLEGNNAGGLTPTEVNPKQQSNHGAAAYPQPLIIDGSAVYVQARGGQVLDLGFDFALDGYRGNELSLFSAHLLEGRTIVEWAYQETPHKVLWIVTDDGALLSLTYVKEQQIFGWARHDTNGSFKNVCVVPEGGEDKVYLVVERTINGTTKQYLERMASRYVTEDTLPGYVGVDCSLSYDGRVASLVAAGTIASVYTMTLSGGTTWDYTETLTLTSSSSYFTAADVGDAIVLNGSGGQVLTFTISGYTSGTVVTGNIERTAPVAMRNVAISDWNKAVDTVSGLDHLEGKAVSILADGNVLANPNDSDYPTYTVSGGSITLDQPYSRIVVGLPYICDLETLDIDSAQGETLADKKKLITQVSLHLEKTRGVFTGPKPPSDDSSNPKENLYAMRHDTPDTLQTTVKTLNILPQWNSNGRVFIRQLDPLPMTILAVTPTGLAPFKKAGG